jgi:epoxyqueuosine reductase
MMGSSPNQRSAHTHLIRQKALELGFLQMGVSKADFLEDEAPRLEKWLKQERHGAMGYMANWFDKRLDPQVLVPGAKSVISLSYNYHNPEKNKDPQAPKISQYAFGEDYHFVLKEKLRDLVSFIESKIGAISSRIFVDSGPVLEKAWAAKSGLGWIGKNSNVIHPKRGSFFFLCEIICDLELESDAPIKDYCGTCRACIDACPTDAIFEPYQVDGSKCISYFTIELKDSDLPDAFKGKFENWAFGCDICQDVCPWNRFSEPHREERFNPHGKLLELRANEWQELSEDLFRELFRKSAVKRTKYKGLMRNIKFLADNNSLTKEFGQD